MATNLPPTLPPANSDDRADPLYGLGRGRGRGRGRGFGVQPQIQIGLGIGISSTSTNGNHLTESPPPAPKSYGQQSTTPSYPFTMDKLKRRVIEPGEKSSFIISTALDYDHFFLRKADDRESKATQFELCDLMNEHMMEVVGKMKTKPQVTDPVEGEVYIVTQSAIGPDGTRVKGGTKNYFRGVVERVTKERYCQTRNLDNGETYLACLFDLTPITEEIFNIPVLAYHVKLLGFANTPNLIFKDTFDYLIKSLQLQKTLFKVNVFAVVGRTTTVSLKLENGDLLVNKILELRKWQWEHLYEQGIRTDDGMMKEFEAIVAKDEHMYNYMNDIQVPYGLDIEAVVKSIRKENKEKNLLPQVVFEPITEYTKGVKEAFRHQLKNYMEKVQATPFFPAIGEMAFVLPPEKTELTEKQKVTREWERCLHMKMGDLDGLYGLDTYNVYPAKMDGLELRQVIPDFRRIPALVLEAQLADPSYDDFTSSCMLKTFMVGKKVTIKLLKRLEFNLFKFESWELQETMHKELTDDCDSSDTE